MDDGVLRPLDEIHVALLCEHELRVESHQELAGVVVHAVVHDNQLGVLRLLPHRADGAKDGDRLVHVAGGNRHIVAADKAFQAETGRIVGALVDAIELVHADVEVVVAVRVIQADAHRVMQLAHNQRNLVRVQVLAQAQAGVSLLLVGVGVLLLRAHRRARVAGTQVVRLDGVVGRLQKLPLDIFGSRTYFHVDARQILLCDRSNQPVLGHVLTCGNKRAIIIAGRGRPGSCAGNGAVFFFAHSCTSFP